jgi:hypothetical protein
MDDRQTARLVAASVLGLVVLIASCAGPAIAVQAGLMPALDWQIPTGAYHVLLIHNGPTVSCAPRALHDSCGPRQVHHEFYIHYITPEGDRQLVWFPIRAP